MTFRQLVKKVVEYTIEDEYKVYRLKGTPFAYRRQYTADYHRLYDCVPVSPGKIVFDNYMGSGYGCNCKYVLKELLTVCREQLPMLDLVWIVKDAEHKKDMFPPQVRLVEYGTKEAFAEYATAAVWVKNFQMVHYLNRGLLKKEGQTYIQMWHGSFGIKKIEGDCSYLSQDRPWTVLAKKNAAYTDYWISNSSFETRVYKEAFWGAGEILEYGHPRNDIFFHDTGDICDKIRKRYKLGNCKIVLYMPTFRDQNRSEAAEIDEKRLTESFRERFGGEWVCALRQHPRLAGKRPIAMGKVLDVTEYPDIQELLVAADAVITDYSSGIFDFMLSGKPGFLLAEDYEKYETIRGLYYPLEQTPFPLARSRQELFDNIRNFDEEAYGEKVQRFLEEKGSVEDGRAAARVVELIRTILKL